MEKYYAMATSDLDGEVMSEVFATMEKSQQDCVANLKARYEGETGEKYADIVHRTAELVSLAMYLAECNSELAEVLQMLRRKLLVGAVNHVACLLKNSEAEKADAWPEQFGTDVADMMLCCLVKVDGSGSGQGVHLN